MGVIYKATCKITGKHYIGQTKRTLQIRKKQHEKSNDDYYFHRAIQKYGKENFQWSILEQCENSKLNSREQFWIQKYNSYANGYNSTKGGDNDTALVNWRKKHPKQVLKNAINGLYYANKYNEQHKEQRLAQLASVRDKGINKVKKKVKCIELDLNFNSIADAERWSLSNENPNQKKASHQQISRVCRGTRKTAGGFHWAYI